MFTRNLTLGYVTFVAVATETDPLKDNGEDFTSCYVKVILETNGKSRVCFCYDQNNISFCGFVKS